MKQALYRKHRPRRFDELVGQEHVSEVLKGAVQTQRISHAYLFTGPRGTGKTSSARILARAINCGSLVEGEPCNTCQLCSEALEGSLPDIIEIDAASHGTVEEARDLVEKASFLPNKATRKVYIIDEVHMLSKSAFNALLKVIEEPPEHVYFILATTESHRVLDTIKSRCQRFEFHLLNDDVIVRHLGVIAQKEGLSVEQEALMLVAQNGRGSIRDSLSLLEQVISGENAVTYDGVIESLGLSSYETVRRFVSALLDVRQLEALAYVRDAYSDGVDLYQFTTAVLGHLRYEMLRAVQAEGGDPVRLRRYLDMIDAFLVCLERLRDPVIAQLPLETAVVELCLLFGRTHEIRVEQSEEVAVPQVEVKTLPLSQGEVSSTGVSSGFDLELFLSHLKRPSTRQLMKQSQFRMEGKDVVFGLDSEFSLEKLSHADTVVELGEALEKLSIPFGRVRLELFAASLLRKDDVKSIFGTSA